MAHQEESLVGMGIQMHFGGVKALDGVDIRIPRGQITGLIGPNGAGKSTLLSILSGSLKPDAGRVVFGPRDITGVGRTIAARAGVVQTFQKASPFRGLSAIDNVLVAMTNHFDPGLGGVLFRPRRTRQVENEWREKARHLLNFFGLDAVAEYEAGSLSFGHLRLLEIARAMLAGPRVLLLDEPAAGLNAQEADLIRHALFKVKDQAIGVLVVDHDVSFLFRLCDRIVAMDYGCVIAEGTPPEIERHPRVRAAYLVVDQQVEERG